MAYFLPLLMTGICISIAFYLFKARQRRSRAEAHRCEPPLRYPHKDPFFGLDLFLKTGNAFTEHRYLPELWQRYNQFGRTFETLNLGSSTINSIEPENLKAVWMTNFNDWGVQPVRLPNMSPFCGRGFISMDGPEWKRSRSLLTPSFNKANISDLAPLERCLQTLLERIPTNGSTVDLQPLFASLYLDATTLFLFGESIGSLSGKNPIHAQGFLEAFETGFSGAGLRIALGPFKVLISNSKWLEACKTTHRFADYYIEKAIQYRHEHLAGPESPLKDGHTRSRILLYNMAEQTDDRIDLRNQIIQALMAAQGTTANLLSNVFFLLARQPEVWQKLRMEVESLKQAKLNFEQLAKMKYLRNVLYETLRLYPVFPQMNRVALRDTILPVGGGSDGRSPIYVSAGTGFDTAYYVLHRLPEIWGPDAGEFKPARWDIFKPGAWEFLPFGSGARMCVGQQKAMMEASYVVTRMLQEFEAIESKDSMDWTGQVQLTAKNVNGCRVSFRPAQAGELQIG